LSIRCKNVLGVVSFRLISFRYRRQSGVGLGLGIKLGLGLGLGEMRLGEMRPNRPRSVEK